MGGSGDTESSSAMQVGEWWIDDDGAWRGGLTLGPFSLPADHESRFDAESGALFHLGMANIRLSANRVLVRWSVQHIMPETLTAVRLFLSSLTFSPRIVLEYYFGAWERLSFSDPEQARACLEAAACYKGTIPMMKPFVRRMPIDKDGTSVPQIQATLKAWERAEGRFSPSSSNAFTPHAERVLAFSPNAREDDMVYDHLGARAALTRFKGQAWADQVHGRTCGRGVEQGDRSDALTGPYGEVLASQKPRLDHIRARITRSTKIPEWVTYQRLLMPARGDRGEPLVLCMSSRTPQVEIPGLDRTA